MAFLAALAGATLDGQKVHYTVSGQGTRTVILVHGWTCDETTWSKQVPALAPHYRVITLDLPGHGKSDPPKDGQYSMDVFARAVETVRAEVGAQRVVLAGHSMGTPVVLRYAKLYPQHTVALVFVDGVMPPRERPNPPAGDQFGGPDGLKNREAFVRGFFTDATTPAIRKKILDMMLAAPESTAVRALNATRTPDAITEDIPPVPILGLFAAEPGVPRATVLARYPQTDYQQIPGTGHFLMLEKPKEFNQAILEFLEKQKY
jgi:pimeloyl-ACP methyl ester carboxylesterase